MSRAYVGGDAGHAAGTSSVQTSPPPLSEAAPDDASPPVHPAVGTTDAAASTNAASVRAGVRATAWFTER